MAVRTGWLVAALVLSIVAGPLRASGEASRQVRKVGFLGGSSAESVPHLLEAFRQGLRGLGWLEGQNLAIEWRWAEGRYERLPGLAAELVRQKVDVIAAATTQSVRAARDATSTISIVMVAVAADPVDAGFVQSLARPGGNVTGVSFMAVALTAKQLELLKGPSPRSPGWPSCGTRPRQLTRSA